MLITDAEMMIALPMIWASFAGGPCAELAVFGVITSGWMLMTWK